MRADYVVNLLKHECWYSESCYINNNIYVWRLHVVFQGVGSIETWKKVISDTWTMFCSYIIKISIILVGKDPVHMAIGM